jgi:phosphoribosylamine--glycine ligase
LNVLVIDSDGVGLDFCMRCQEHGHSVKLFIKKDHGDRDSTGDGLVEKVPEWEKWMQWADLILPTHNTVYLDRLEYFRSLNYPIFGPSKQSAQLEINRSYGMSIFKKYGIETPPYKMFQSLDDAETYSLKSGKRTVFKTLGSEEDKSLSYVGKSPDDMANRIRSWKKKGMKLKGSCMLQDCIDGVELGVSAWMGRDGFLGGFGENVEYKKLMPGNYGPNTGEMGTVMWYTEKSSLAKQVLNPLESFLLSVGHRGDLDVNCIVDEKGKVWPLEFTARLGWPAFWIMTSQHEEPVQWMLNSLQGKDSLKYSKDVFTGLVIAQPPFPHNGANKSELVGIPIQGITRENWSDVHLVSAKVGKGFDSGREKEMFVTTGTYVACVTGQGSTVRKAARKAYALAEQIYVPNQIVRDDIGEDLVEKLPLVQKHGFATSVEA